MGIRSALVLFGLFAALIRAGAGDKPAKHRVTASRPAGLCEAPFAVALNYSGPHSAIRFTVDGTAPNATNGLLYTKTVVFTNTALLRAAAFQGSSPVSPVTTLSYLVLNQTLHQPEQPEGLPRTWRGLPAAYKMDPRIVDDPAYQDRMRASLESLPLLSVVCRQPDLFDPSQGIYLNTMEKGEQWQKPCSAEFISQGTEPGFQIDCGLRIQGNMNRVPNKSPKHSFRLVFSGKYGPSKLHYRIFPDSPVTKFDTLILRADYNTSWIHWDAAARPRAQRVRDAWLKDSQRAMGWVAPHSRYLHLFLNGLYWGVYDASERPDASFAAAYLGGTREDYDVINEFDAKDGTLDAFRTFYSISGLARTDQYELLKRHLDITEFIDYLLLNYYAGNNDWGEQKNWYALRRRNPPSPFQYIVWDGEQILHGLNDDTISDPYVPPLRLAMELRSNAEFRLAFADRVQKHFFDGGALTPGAVAERWNARSQQVDLAMIAESARWGYYRRSPPYTRDREWVSERQRLLKNYFPQRTAVVLEQLKAAGLYPKVAAPTIETKNGLKLSASGGANVFYTTNGTDPRLPGGAVSKDAHSHDASTSIPAKSKIKARALKDNEWSALVELSAQARSAPSSLAMPFLRVFIRGCALT